MFFIDGRRTPLRFSHFGRSRFEKFDRNAKVVVHVRQYEDVAISDVSTSTIEIGQDHIVRSAIGIDDELLVALALDLEFINVLIGDPLCLTYTSPVIPLAGSQMSRTFP